MKPKGLKADLKYFIDRLKDSSAELYAAVFVQNTPALTIGKKSKNNTLDHTFKLSRLLNAPRKQCELICGVKAPHLLPLRSHFSLI